MAYYLSIIRKPSRRSREVFLMHKRGGATVYSLRQSTRDVVQCPLNARTQALYSPCRYGVE